MKTKNILFFAIIALLFTSCANDDDDDIRFPGLVVEQEAITITEGETAFIPITSGGGNLQVASSNESVATAVISQNRIAITVVGNGTATITITDAVGRRVTITVTGTSNAVNDTALRLEWDGDRILLDEANGWSIIQNFPTTGNIGIIHLEQKRVLRITGNNNYNVGVKPNVRLHIIENGEAEQTIALDRFEIVENTEGVFTAVGNAGDRRLVVRYRVN
jgi:hypothetical protein